MPRQRKRPRRADSWPDVPSLVTSRLTLPANAGLFAPAATETPVKRLPLEESGFEPSVPRDSEPRRLGV